MISRFQTTAIRWFFPKFKISILMMFFSIGYISSASAVLAVALGWSSAHADEFSLIAEKSDLSLHSTMSVLQGNYLLLDQGKLEELDYNGKVVRTMSLQKGFWSEAEETLDGGLYSATYTATDTKKTAQGAWPAIFRMTAIFGVQRSVTVESPAICSACTAGTSGMCQHNVNKKCKAFNPSTNSCPNPRNFSPCSRETVVERDLLTFSVALSNWAFQDALNTLRLKLTLEPKKDKKVFPVASDDWAELNLEETGLITLPTLAVVEDLWQNSQYMSVGNTVDFDEKKATIEFNIPSFADGSAYYNYDPDLNLL